MHARYMHACTFNLKDSIHVGVHPQALRVATWSHEANGSFPLVFVTRQGKAVNSWTVPFVPPE